MAKRSRFLNSSSASTAKLTCLRGAAGKKIEPDFYPREEIEEDSLMDLKYICTHIKSLRSIATVNTTINSNPKSPLPSVVCACGAGPSETLERQTLHGRQ